MPEAVSVSRRVEESSAPTAAATPTAPLAPPEHIADTRENGSHDTTAYVHATSGGPPEPTHDDPSAEQRRLRLMAAGAAGLVVLLVLLISILSGDDEPQTTTTDPATTTTAATTSTTTTTIGPVATTLPPIGTTPASALAPQNWRIVFYNDFEENRDDAFPLGEITGNASATIVNGTYSVDITKQNSMETLLQIPLTSKFAFFGATIHETRIEPGAHVCGLIFTTNEQVYVVTINAEVSSGPREYAIVDGNGREVLAVTGSIAVKPGTNDVTVLVKTPNYRLYINGEEVAKGKVKGKQVTGFGLTYGASSAGRCGFDNVEVWRPPVAAGDDAGEGSDAGVLERSGAS